MNGSISFNGSLIGDITGGGGGSGDAVIITPVVTSGTKIADVSVNGVEKDLYCPTPPAPTEVEVTPVQQSGTKIATIEVDGNEVDLYAPNINGHVYSTSEHVVGVWVDGRPIYEKTVIFGTIPTQNYSLPLGVNSSDILLTFFVPDGSYINDDSIPFPYVLGSGENNIGGFFSRDNTELSFEFRIGLGMVGNISNGAITFRYTKSSDTPTR